MKDRTPPGPRFTQLFGVGGIGSGLFFELEEQHTLGRNESRAGRLLNIRDYCKLHIVLHYVAAMLDLKSDASRSRVAAIGKVGDDPVGRSLISEMQNIGIDTQYVETVANRSTLMSICFQYPDGSGGNISSNNSAAAALSYSDLDAFDKSVDTRNEQTIALAVPEVPLDVRRELLRRGTEKNIFTIASFTAGEMDEVRRLGVLHYINLLAVNEEEATALLEFSVEDQDLAHFAKKCLQFLDEVAPRMQLVVSLGARGALGFENRRWVQCAAPRVDDIRSTAGAGDALLGGIIFCLMKGMPLLPFQDQSTIHSALQLGVLLATYKVTSLHSIHPDVSLETLAKFAESSGFDLRIV